MTGTPNRGIHRRARLRCLLIKVNSLRWTFRNTPRVLRSLDIMMSDLILTIADFDRECEALQERLQDRLKQEGATQVPRT